MSIYFLIRHCDISTDKELVPVRSTAEANLCQHAAINNHFDCLAV